MELDGIWRDSGLPMFEVEEADPLTVTTRFAVLKLVVALSRASNSFRAFWIPGRSGLPAPTHWGSEISVIIVCPFPSEMTRW